MHNCFTATPRIFRHQLEIASSDQTRARVCKGVWPKYCGMMASWLPCSRTTASANGPECRHHNSGQDPHQPPHSTTEIFVFCFPLDVTQKQRLNLIQIRPTEVLNVYDLQEIRRMIHHAHYLLTYIWCILTSWYTGEVVVVVGVSKDLKWRMLEGEGTCPQQETRTVPRIGGTTDPHN